MRDSAKIKHSISISKMFSIVVASSIIVSLLLNGCSSVDDTVIKADKKSSSFLYSEQGDYDELIQIINKQISVNRNSNYAQKVGDMAESAAEDAAANDAGSGDGSGYSETNNQVAGVDEADVIKTDGSSIFLLVNNRLIIVDAAKPDNLKILSETKWNEYSENTDSVGGESPVELYLDIPGKRIAVITQSYSYPKYIEPEPRFESDGGGSNGESLPPDSGGSPEIIETSEITQEELDRLEEQKIAEESKIQLEREQASAELPVEDAAVIEPDIRINPIFSEKIYTTTYIYNISDPSSPQKERSFVQEGNYVSSRKINEYIYIVSQKYQYAVYDLANDSAAKPDEILPAVSQNGNTDQWKVVSAEDVRIMPDGDMSNQLVMSGLDMNNPLNDANIVAVLGSTGIIYSSTENMYVAGARYVYDEITNDVSTDADSAIMPVDYWMPAETFTDIYKFSVSKGSIIEQGKGTVPGYLINQFSLDEHNGYLRIAVTNGGSWNSGQQNSDNGVYILDEKLEIVGQATGLAKGEMIKSVRFMGDNAWMVTFRTTDPLFGIDLSVPENPKVLSELKLPGYSSYLHPVPGNMLVGFGYDVEVKGDNAYEKGLKISLFDISDISSPIELDSMILGERGSWSEIVYQHKSLMSDDANLLYGFPATLNNNIEGDEYSFGNIYFQGLVLLDISSGKLGLKGGISHIDGLSDPVNSANSVKNSEYLAYGSGAVFRGVRIGSRIFTLSREKLQSNDLGSLDITGHIDLPGAEQEKDYIAYREASIAEKN